MPRLSNYKPNKGNDYNFFDKRMSEMFTIGGVSINLHMYLGPIPQTNSTSATEPKNLTQSVKNIQDLLFLENRDRKYDTSVYTMRTVYRMNDNDFDLSQFGLFLTGDTMFMVFHLNDMINQIGRKIMVGDVMELPHLKDLYPLDTDLPSALKRYYTVSDASRAAEGFSQSWYPHLWRVKVQPLVDSQEYKDITTNIKAGTNTNSTLKDLLSTYDKYSAINDAIVTRAEVDVPMSGYDTSHLYTVPMNADGSTADPTPLDASNGVEDTTEGNIDVSSGDTLTSIVKLDGYLTSDGLPANGAHVAAGITFPPTPGIGEFFLRVDYVPNRLFRWEGARWAMVEDNVRTNLTPGATNTSLFSSFVNNPATRMKNAIAWDAIRIASPYIVPANNAATSSFTLSTKTVATKVPYHTTYGVKAYLNGTIIPNTIANVSSNISFTVTNTLSTNDVLEYTVFTKVSHEKQGLSVALTPLADNI